VTLEFFEGTQTTLAPNTDLMLENIDGQWGNVLQVELIQNEGETKHQVVPLRGDQATYQVLTPSGEASVRGTSFKVLVEDNGMSLFTVETGEVLVSNDGTETYLAAGQGVITELGKPLPSPLYSFNLLGDLDKIEGKIWYVEGVPITVKGGTKITGDPQEEKPVFVMGHTTKKHEWIADYIRALEEGDKGGSFTGVVTSAIGDGLAINGYDFIVDENQPDVAVGDLVRVTFEITEQGWVVLSLVPLDGGDDDDDDPDDDEILFFSPEESEITDCEPVVGSMREFTTSLIYSPEDTGLQPLDVLLTMSDNRDELGESFVESITVSREGTILDLTQPITLLSDGETIELVVTVTLGAGFDRLPPESKLEIQVVAEGEVEGVPLSAIFKIEWECDEEVLEVLFFSPEESEITDCETVVGSMREFTTSLIYSPEDTGLQPLDVLLTMSDNRDELGEGFVESITISREGTVLDLTQPITLLSAGETIELVVTVTLGAGFDRLPPESKLEIQVVATEVVTGTVDGEPLSAIFKIEWECDEEIPDVPDDDGDKCTRAEQHPHALTLANDPEYSSIPWVDYDKIWDWFCLDNLGFGEIELGFKLYLEYEEVLPLEGVAKIATIDDIFAMRLGGMGWGQVKHEMATLAREALPADEPAAKKEPPGKEKSEEAKNKVKPNKKGKGDD
jgi:hypothetical protein